MRSKRRYISILLLSLILASCESAKEPKTILEATSTKIDITEKLTPIYIPEDSIGNPGFILSFANTLILGDNSKSDLLNIFNLHTKECQQPLIKGRGPLEALRVGKIDRYNGDSFYIFDYFTNKMMFFDLSDNELYKLVDVVQADSCYNPFIDDDTIIGLSSSDKGRYWLGKKNDSGFCGDYTEYGLSNLVGGQLMRGLITSNNSLKKFGWFAYNADAFQIVDYSKGSLKIVRSKAFGVPSYKISKNDNEEEIVAFDDANSTVCFKSVTCNDESIFALYSGNKFGDYFKIGNDFELGNYIIVIDWSGDVKSELYCENKISCLSYNAEQQKLFCVVLDQQTGKFGIMTLDI